MRKEKLTKSQKLLKNLSVGAVWSVPAFETNELALTHHKQVFTLYKIVRVTPFFLHICKTCSNNPMDAHSDDIVTF